MRKIIAVLVTALALIVPLLTFASPAQADQASARAGFDTIAETALDQMLALHPIVEPGMIRDEEGWQSAYTAEMLAYRHGTWNNSESLAYLEKVYESAVRNSNGDIIGYGKNYSRDAFDDGTFNSANTIYTVTMTDHVGEPLLAGYDAGVVPAARIQEIVDGVWNQPRYKTNSLDPDIAVGKCVAYTNSAYDQPAALNDTNRHWCILNVSVGAASWLQKTQDRGFTPTGATTAEVDTLIQDLYNFIDWAQGRSDAGANTIGTHWAYSFRSLDRDFNKAPQDANHATYTAESVRALHETTGAVTTGQTALDRFTTNGDHVPADNIDANDYQNLLATRGFDIVGRQRGAGLSPTANQRGLLAEAQWWTNAALAGSVEGYDKAYAWGQIGRWAARLATSAKAEAEQARQIDFMSKPRVYDYPYKANGDKASLTSVKKGSKYTIWTDARYYDLDNVRHFATNIPIRLKIGVGNNTPSLFDTKSTGYEWYGARFTYTVPSSTSATSLTICSEITADQAGGLTVPGGGCRVVSITN